MVNELAEKADQISIPEVGGSTEPEYGQKSEAELKNMSAQTEKLRHVQYDETVEIKTNPKRNN